MGRYLNSRVPFEAYREIAETRFFVDKSLLIEDILSADAIILELKAGSTPKKAIQQIRDRNYVLRLRGKLWGLF